MDRVPAPTEEPSLSQVDSDLPSITSYYPPGYIAGLISDAMRAEAKRTAARLVACGLSPDEAARAVAEEIAAGFAEAGVRL